MQQGPVFLITDEAKERLATMGATGVVFDDAEVTFNEEFRELEQTFHSGRELPGFCWMKIDGTPGTHDVGLTEDQRLVVSKRVLSALMELCLCEAEVEPFDGKADGKP